MGTDDPRKEPQHSEVRDQAYMLGWELLQIAKTGKGTFGEVGGVEIELPPWLKQRCEESLDELKELEEDPEHEMLPPIEAAIRKKAMEEFLLCTHEHNPETTSARMLQTCIHCDQEESEHADQICFARVKALLENK